MNYLVLLAPWAVNLQTRATLLSQSLPLLPSASGLSSYCPQPSCHPLLPPHTPLAVQVSAHLPLSRLAGSFLAALLYLATRQGASPALGPASQALQGRGILGGSAGGALVEEAGGGAGAARYDPLPVAALGSLRVLSWMSQVRG